MSFDFFTFFAQIINFFILLFLLRRFLYKPILKVIDERKEMIAGQFLEAEQQAERAKEANASLKKEQKELENNRDAIVREAKHEVEDTKQQLLLQARAEVSQQQTAWQEAFIQEKDETLLSLQQGLSTELQATIKRSLHDLADVELETQVLQVFLSKIQSLGEPEVSTLQTAFKASQGQANLLTAFPITSEVQAEIESSLAKILGQTIKLTMEQQADLVCGLELQVDDQKLSWSLKSYQDELFTIMTKMLNQQVLSGYVTTPQTKKSGISDIGVLSQ